MRFSEFDSIPESEKGAALQKLSPQQVDDLCDEIPFRMVTPKIRDDCQYFESVHGLEIYLRKNIVPAAKPWRAREAANHELAHAQCANALGVTSVRYVVLDDMDQQDLNQVRFEMCGQLYLPNLAYAAIAVHPYDSGKSITDMRSIRSYGYRSRDDVLQRIARWNERLADELVIPQPQLVYADLMDTST